MARTTKADITEKTLLEQGWSYHHSALVSLYRPAGTVSRMQTRKGYEYCRVHCGRCKNVDIKGGPWHEGWNTSMQVTWVYSRPVTA